MACLQFFVIHSHCDHVPSVLYCFKADFKEQNESVKHMHKEFGELERKLDGWFLITSMLHDIYTFTWIIW